MSDNAVPWPDDDLELIRDLAYREDPYVGSNPVHTVRRLLANIQYERDRVNGEIEAIRTVEPTPAEVEAWLRENRKHGADYFARWSSRDVLDARAALVREQTEGAGDVWEQIAAAEIDEELTDIDMSGGDRAE